jgi:hypothetical protein
MLEGAATVTVSAKKIPKSQSLVTKKKRTMDGSFAG